jgi:hypothetical protein
VIDNIYISTNYAGTIQFGNGPRRDIALVRENLKRGIWPEMSYVQANNFTTNTIPPATNPTQWLGSPVVQWAVCLDSSTNGSSIHKTIGTPFSEATVTIGLRPDGIVVWRTNR